jgi:hypothetical protein
MKRKFKQLRGHFVIIKPTRCINFTNLFWHETLHVSDSSSVHHQEFIHHDGPARKLYIPLLSVQWINSWWWTDELSETCSVSWQNKFLKLVQLFGFITKKALDKSRSKCSCSKTVYKPVWHTPLLTVQWIIPGDGQTNCPKHVEFHDKINLWN